LAKENLMRQYFDSEQSGSTVGKLFLNNNNIYLALSVIYQDQVISANLGDSRVIVCG
jgi:serine/threonine protein phosphatase PrpC